MIQWGNVAEWTGAVGTIGAFLAAGILLSRELKSHREADEDRRKRYASGVAAWIEFSQVGEVMIHYPHLFVRNANQTPIYKCEVVLGPAHLFLGSERRYNFHVIGPGRTRDETIEGPIADFPSDEPPFATLTLVDTEGRKWTRYADGTLIDQETLK